jgi:hypothetical protein
MIKSSNIKWAEHAARMWSIRNVYKIFVGMPEGKRQLGRSRRRWKGNISMNIREIKWECVDWINLTPVGGQFHAPGVNWIGVGLTIFAPVGNRTTFFQAIHYTDWTIPTWAIIHAKPLVCFYILHACNPICKSGFFFFFFLLCPSSVVQ